MSDAMLRWRDTEGEVHTVTLNGIHEDHGSFYFGTAQTACGIRLFSRVLPTQEPLTCAACIERETSSCLRQAEAHREHTLPTKTRDNCLNQHFSRQWYLLLPRWEIPSP